MSSSLFQRAFAGGELAPSLAARADLAKYITGLRSCRNFMVLRHGGVANRPGTRYIGPTKTGSISTFLLRYVSAVANESLLLEAGPFYLRVYKNGALVRVTDAVAWDIGVRYEIGAIVSSEGGNFYCKRGHTAHAPSDATYWYPMPGDVFEMPTPFGSSGFNWVQSANILTLTSLYAPPYELEYFSLTQWAIRQVRTVPTIQPPTAVAIAPGVTGVRGVRYIVTSGAADTFEESTGSAQAQALTVGEPTPDKPHVITWTAPAGQTVAEYYVYKDPFDNGTFGFIGTATDGTTFHDAGMLPDFAVTPPTPVPLFNATGDYPARAAYYQQRRFFAHTLNQPDAVWGSRVGFHSNFMISSPLQDDDALTFRIAGNQANPVRHLIGLKTLDVLTDGGAWTVGQSKTPLTPGNLPADQETYVGIGDAPPVVIGNAILYVEARGSIVRDLQFDLQVEGLAGRDLTLFASHLFDGFTIARLDYQATPHSIVWACRSDGTLLGLTYLREQDVWGWHRHDSGAHARFEDVCVVPEGTQDAVYLLVRRTIAGGFVRYIERLESRDIHAFNADSFFVDAGLTYSGPPVTAVHGLEHLNGQVVAVVADGRVVFDGDPSATRASAFTVHAGTIIGPLPSASIIHVGLPIRFAELELLDLDVQGSSIRDLKKRVGSVGFLLEASVRTFQAGPTFDRLRQVILKPHEAGLAGVPYTGLEQVTCSADYDESGRVCLRHTDPLPLTVLGVLPRVELGG